MGPSNSTSVNALQRRMLVGSGPLDTRGPDSLVATCFAATVAVLGAQFSFDGAAKWEKTGECDQRR